MNSDDEPSPAPAAEPAAAADPRGPAGPAEAGDELSEQRFRAVVRTLIAPAQGGLLLGLGPDEARLLYGAGLGVLVLLDRSRSEAELSARLEELISEQGAKLRLLLVSARPWAVDCLTQLKLRAPSGLAIFHIAPDGKVWSPSSLLLSDLRAGLRAQARAELQPGESHPQFLGAMEPVLQSTAAQVGDIRSFASALNARPVRLTYALLVLCAALYAVTEYYGGPERAGVLVRMGAEVPERIRGGEWWRLLSATVLHGGFIHLLMNGLVLWNLGTFMERLLGWGRFLTVYVLAGLFGTVLGTLLSPLLQFGLSVGASGSLFGLLGASAVLAFRPSGLPELLVRDLKKSATQNLLLNVIASLRPHIDWAAHLGGALVGGFLVLIGAARPLPLGLPGSDGEGDGDSAEAGRRRSDKLFSVVGALLGLLLLGCTALALIKGQPWQLRDVAAAQPVAIAETGLTMAVPVLLGSPRPVARTDGLTEVSLGGEDAGQWVSLMVSPLGEDLATPEQRQAVWASSVDELKRFRPKEQATVVGEPQVYDLGGNPTLEVRFLFSSGVEYKRLTQLRAQKLVILELTTPPKLAEAQKVNVRGMLESIQETKDAQAPR